MQEVPVSHQSEPGPSRRGSGVYKRPLRRVVVLDHFDSFTFNLVQLLKSLGAHCSVLTSAEVDVPRVRALHADGLLLSPGPGHPDDARRTLHLLDTLQRNLPVLGVCLGHQALALDCGARIERASRVLHGKAVSIRHDGAGLFRGLPNPLKMARYNSLSVQRASLPPRLALSAWDDAEEVMGIRHRELPREGIQFHPESILSEAGDALISNWLDML